MIKLYIAIIGKWEYALFWGGGLKKTDNHAVLTEIIAPVSVGHTTPVRFFTDTYYSTKSRKNQESKFWNGDDR